MDTRYTLSAGFVAGALLWSAAAMAQQTRSPDCTPQSKATQAPATVEGKVTKLDPASGTVMILEADGRVHELQVPKETLQKVKVGDHLAAKLRTC